jgi:hypothetical protein
MLKKILILVAILAVTCVLAASVLSRKAPALLRDAIERSLNKRVTIQAIDYVFPATFELTGFRIEEKEGRFDKETSFYADHIRLVVSPMSLSRRMLLLDKVSVQNAEVTIRKYAGHLAHALSDTLKKRGESAGKEKGPAKPAPRPLPLEIREFILRDSYFRFIDYDVDASGFVVTLERIDAQVNRIHFPLTSKRTTYKVDAHMPQGRDQKPAEIHAAGWTVFATRDTDTNISAKGIFIPYFKPYYIQVTPALIEDGYLDARVNLRLEENNLKLNADLELAGLLFSSYEQENQLFGLKADEILAFLKDRSGKLKFQFVSEWNIADRSASARNTIRKSIEKSLKNTVLGNLGNILEHTLQKIGDQGVEKTRGDLESKIKKLKDFLKY